MLLPFNVYEVVLDIMCHYNIDIGVLLVTIPFSGPVIMCINQSVVFFQLTNCVTVVYVVLLAVNIHMDYFRILILRFDGLYEIFKILPFLFTIVVLSMYCT